MKNTPLLYLLGSFVSFDLKRIPVNKESIPPT
jgi:hypothetical protein